MITSSSVPVTQLCNKILTYVDQNVYTTQTKDGIARGSNGLPPERTCDPTSRLTMECDKLVHCGH